MKKLFFALPLAALLAAGCNSSQQATNQTPVQAPVVQNTNPAPAPSQVPIPVPTNTPGIPVGWSTYTDTQFTQFGYQISLPPHYVFSGEMIPNSAGRLDLTSANQNFNDAAEPSTGEVGMQVSKFSKAPKTGQAACAGGDQRYDSNGKPLACNPQMMFAQDNMLTFAQTIANTHISQPITLPAFVYGGNGTVVNLNGNKGVLVLARNAQAVGSNATLYFFDKSSNLVTIYQDFVSFDDPKLAAQTQQYKDFLTIISTIKFSGDFSNWPD